MKRFHSRMVLAAALSGSLVVPAIAFAGDCSGYFAGTIDSSSSIEVANGHSISFWTTRQTSDTNNSGYTGVGMCNGSMLTLPSGAAQVSGACALKDKNGDSWSFAYGIEPGAERGWWKTTGGTGKLAAKSSGWFQQTVTDGKTSLGIWGGNCN